MKKQHKHNFKLSHTTQILKTPTTGTAGRVIEYAYMVCDCGKVIKTKVEQK